MWYVSCSPVHEGVVERSNGLGFGPTACWTSRLQIIHLSYLGAWDYSRKSKICFHMESQKPGRYSRSTGLSLPSEPGCSIRSCPSADVQSLHRPMVSAIHGITKSTMKKAIRYLSLGYKSHAIYPLRQAAGPRISGDGTDLSGAKPVEAQTPMLKVLQG